MAQEIERKFLVNGNAWKQHQAGVHYRQGYLIIGTEKSVRVRTDEHKGWLTIKSRASGITRQEFEYEVPLTDANEMLLLCEESIIEKIRYTLSFAGSVWEVDEFLGDNAGLVIAEIELKSEDQEFDKPDWLSDEVTYDARYLNVNLSKHPFKAWENII